MQRRERSLILTSAALAVLALATPCFAKPTSLVQLSGVRPVELIQRFNADAAETRLLVVLSPTCKECVRGASALQTFLAASPGERVRVFVVWAPALPEEKARPASDVTARISDGRAQQFWDPTRVVASLVRAAADAGVKRFAEYKTGGHPPYDFVAVYPAGARWDVRVPSPAYLGSPLASSMNGLEKALEAKTKART